MRNYKWLVLVLLSFSCANEVSKEMHNEHDLSIENNGAYEEMIAARKLSLTQLATQKLTTYFELVQLKKAHPAFKEEIGKQLKALSDVSLVDTNGVAAISVKNIRQIGVVKHVSDTVKELKLYYDIEQDNEIKTDSVYASIISQMITIDGSEALATKIFFKKAN